MSETSGEFAIVYVPTRRERFWRWIGFRYHLGQLPNPDVEEPLQGWMQNTCFFRFDLKDRLRLLVTGRLKVVVTFDLDVPSPDKIRTRMDWQILAPGEPR